VTHNPGVGIGPLARHPLRRAHGGRAWVEDRDGGGASFRVYLPFASASDAPLEDLQPDGTLVPTAAIGPSG
jgi:signal transduction histidine kinase